MLNKIMEVVLRTRIPRKLSKRPLVPATAREDAVASACARASGGGGGGGAQCRAAAARALL